MRIRVGIAGRLLESADDCRSWTEGVRVIPRPSEPRIRGARERLVLPILTAGEFSDVHIGPDGFGFAAGWEPTGGHGSDPRDRAKFWRTRDGGATWEPIHPDIGWWGRLRAFGSWPPERVDSVSVLAGGMVAFAWEDPWLFDGPHCHLALSPDRGDTWRYRRLPDDCNWLACGLGPLRVFSDGRLVEWSGAMQREPLKLDWSLPPAYRPTAVPLRSAQFMSEAEGFALVVKWPKEDPPKPPPDLPPLVGLARTQDGGRLWKVMNTWEGPRSTDLNVRHVVVLDLG